MVIHGLQKLTLLDYPGHTACTVFTAHCPWRCPFCHNASLVLEPESQPVIPEEAQRVIMVIGIDGVGKTIRAAVCRTQSFAFGTGGICRRNIPRFQRSFAALRFSKCFI